ncbi:hypothetical protein Taro_048452 [Colocasia esculenta]|uniref:Uncharacterized protein n=1 Tax=Colocasia esculenta TaxID=4460 RepID=A0A843X2S0_COLES|nr:hypothetical protein [Colocasia esculenta]
MTKMKEKSSCSKPFLSLLLVLSLLSSFSRALATSYGLPWLREVGVAERRPVRTSRDVTSGRSSRSRHRKVLYFPHRRLWIMEYSCKVWCKTCRRRLIPRQHSRHSVVGDDTLAEEAVETDSERGD